eukprot:1917640-Pyramimonas_sp.AAC.1
MKDSNGETQTKRQRTADVFADFCAELYASSPASQEADAARLQPAPGVIAPFTIDELRGGICAEMFKHGGDTLETLLLDLADGAFARVLQALRGDGIAHIRRCSGPEEIGPITIIPLLYKLFAELVH